MKKERNGLKVLHKIGKSWVAVAAAGLIGLSVVAPAVGGLTQDTVRAATVTDDSAKSELSTINSAYVDYAQQITKTNNLKTTIAQDQKAVNTLTSQLDAAKNPFAKPGKPTGYADKNYQSYFGDLTISATVSTYAAYQPTYKADMTAVRKAFAYYVVKIRQANGLSNTNMTTTNASADEVAQESVNLNGAGEMTHHIKEIGNYAENLMKFPAVHSDLEAGYVLAMTWLSDTSNATKLGTAGHYGHRANILYTSDTGIGLAKNSYGLVSMVDTSYISNDLYPAYDAMMNATAKDSSTNALGVKFIYSKTQATTGTVNKEQVELLTSQLADAQAKLDADNAAITASRMAYYNDAKAIAGAQANLASLLGADYSYEGYHVGDIINLANSEVVAPKGGTIAIVPNYQVVDGKSAIKTTPLIPMHAVGTINYVPGYGVLLKNGQGKVPAKKQYLKHGSNWKIVAQKTINGDIYYGLGNDNQWIQGKYLLIKDAPTTPTKPTTPTTPTNPDVTAKSIIKVVYSGKGKVALWNGDHTQSGKYVANNASFKVFATKTMSGKTFYRLGNDTQWIDSQYAKLVK